MNKRGILIVVLVLMLLLVIFTVQNYEAVQIRFLFWSITTSRAIIIFLSFFIGVLVGWAIPLMKRSKEK